MNTGVYLVRRTCVVRQASCIVHRASCVVRRASCSCSCSCSPRLPLPFETLPAGRVVGQLFNVPGNRSLTLGSSDHRKAECRFHLPFFSFSCFLPLFVPLFPPSYSCTTPKITPSIDVLYWQECYSSNNYRICRSHTNKCQQTS